VAIHEEDDADPISPDDISPELMYTAEHQVPALKPKTVSEPLPPAGTGASEEASSKRRRGRRGGRRGRGSDDSSSPGGQ
ncbi:MAG TPA: hypothetical protein VM166_03550, partial [Gemmatimonadaceae bacterium]|nr:hypothetical protein [Gemmatimonadaceae bacterium]